MNYETRKQIPHRMMSPGIIVNTDNFHNFHNFEKKVYYQTGPQAQLMIYLKQECMYL